MIFPFPILLTNLTHEHVSLAFDSDLKLLNAQISDSRHADRGTISFLMVCDYIHTRRLGQMPIYACTAKHVCTCLRPLNTSDATRVAVTAIHAREIVSDVVSAPQSPLATGAVGHSLLFLCFLLPV
jgi:hypothetical protein